MKGAVIVVLAIALMGLCGTVMANAPLVPPVQFEQFCDNQKVSGTGVIDVSNSVIDKKIALEYYNTMNGDGDLELDQETAYSQDADKLKRNISSVNGGNESNLNLVQSTKMTYKGDTPLTGGKMLNSKAFYGGIGANVQELYVKIDEYRKVFNMPNKDSKKEKKKQSGPQSRMAASKPGAMEGMKRMKEMMSKSKKK